VFLVTPLQKKTAKLYYIQLSFTVRDKYFNYFTP
jgi:hypothetical protein